MPYIMKDYDDCHQPTKNFDPVGRISCSNCRHSVPNKCRSHYEVEMYGRQATGCAKKPASYITQPNIDWCFLFAIHKS